MASDTLGYGLTKHAGQLTLQLVAQDTPAEKMQVIGYHPGAIFTDAARAHGWTEDSFAWDHGTSSTPEFSSVLFYYFHFITDL